MTIMDDRTSNTIRNRTLAYQLQQLVLYLNSQLKNHLGDTSAADFMIKSTLRWIEGVCLTEY